MIRNVLGWLWLGVRCAWELRQAERGERPAPYTLTPKAWAELEAKDRIRWN